MIGADPTPPLRGERHDMTACAAMTSKTNAAKGVSVARLKLSEFRNYARLDLPLDSGGGPVVLTGPNGAGKTNLLEAVSLLAPGRGLRGAALPEIGRHGAATPWAVHARLATPDGPVELGTGLQTDGDGPPRRRVRIDGETAGSPAALGRYVKLLWLTPAMDRLFMEGGTERRRFLDRIVLTLHGDHGRQVAAFERAMRERNRLLAEYGTAADAAWLAALEGRMAEAAVAVAAARRETVAQLDACARRGASPAFPQAAVSVSGWLEDGLAAQSALDVEDSYRDALRAQRPRDAAAGRSLVGPHRSDLEVLHLGKAMPAAQCSTGEQKALLIALVLAHADLTLAVTGGAPALLLDEIVAHLDAERRLALFDALAPLGGQSWLTGTDPALFAGLADRAQAFHIEDGRVTASRLV